MGVSTCKSTPGTSDQPGLFIGVHIDFTEFRIAILSEEWKDVEEKKAITSDHPIEIPKSEVQEPLVDRIARKLKKNILRNEEFRGLRVKKIVISYNEADEVHDTLKASFRAAIKKKGIRTIDRGQIECMRISTVYYDLIFTGGSPNERLAKYNVGHARMGRVSEGCTPKQCNGILFCGSNMWSLRAEIEKEGEPEVKTHTGGKGATDEQGSGYAIARNVINQAIACDFKFPKIDIVDGKEVKVDGKVVNGMEVGGKYLLDKIQEHLGLTNQRDIVRAMNQGGMRFKLASFARAYANRPDSDKAPGNLGSVVRNEFNSAGQTHITEYLGIDEDRHMAYFLIGFRRSAMRYFKHDKKPVEKTISIKWYGLNEELDNPEVAAAYLASSMVMREPLHPLGLNAAFLNAAVLDAAVLNAAVLNAAILNAAVLNAAIFNAAILNAAIFNAAIFNAAILNAAVLNAAIFNAAILNAAVSNAAIFNAAILNAAILNAAILNAAILDAAF
ncbi:unnamed protein product [Caenorhabditis brenneri]